MYVLMYLIHRKISIKLRFKVSQSIKSPALNAKNNFMMLGTSRSTYYWRIFRHWHWNESL